MNFAATIANSSKISWHRSCVKISSKKFKPFRVESLLNVGYSTITKPQEAKLVYKTRHERRIALRMVGKDQVPILKTTAIILNLSHAPAVSFAAESYFSVFCVCKFQHHNSCFSTSEYIFYRSRVMSHIHLHNGRFFFRKWSHVKRCKRRGL